MRNLFLLLSISSLLFSCENAESEQNQESSQEKQKIAIIPYQVLSNSPHDINSFTEGLEFYKGNLFESSAFVAEHPNTTSSIGTVNIKTGNVDKKIMLDGKLYFSEGITILDDKIYHVTYKNQKGFVYDANTYKLIKEFSYKNIEGWGLTNDGKNIIMSDGTHTLTYFDPNTLEVLKQLNVTENGTPIKYLNELEFINGYIYANIYTLDQIAKIDTATGNIVGTIDLSNLKKDATAKFSGSLETNGIAYNQTDSTITVTGKLWPAYYRIKIPL
jgi:glutamine cyclotransferase